MRQRRQPLHDEMLAQWRSYDSVQTWLKLFPGRLNPRNNGTLHGTLSTFDQTEFGAASKVSLNSTGTDFVPKGCAQGKICGMVLALHGCK